MASSMVGMSGKTGLRSGLIVASALILPASSSTFLSDSGGVTKSTAPEATSCSEGPPPCEGTQVTWSGSMPAATIRPTQAR
jgi:hypothetical protein